MMDGMLMRRATDGDWLAIWPVWHAVVAAGETYTWAPDTPEAQARRLWMAPPPAEVWLAIDEPGGRVLGTALLRPNQPGLGAHVANAGFMVAPDAAGRGVGRTLAERVLDRARELGYLGMQFNAVVATNIRAIALWESLGFAVVGTVPKAFRHARDGLVDLHIMYRSLAD
jgi:L-amino acid N-acyltransferase YncA